MFGIVRVSATGRIVALDEAAADVLGSVIGRRCCDVIVGRDGGRVVCDPNCAAKLVTGENEGNETIVVDGQRGSAECRRVGDEVIVVVRPGQPEGERLTPREREVLACVARGWSTARIAEELGVLPSTVRTHTERARSKLGAHTRAEAVVRALARGELNKP